MEPPPSQMTVLGWTDVAAIDFSGSPFERALFDVLVLNPYAPSIHQPLIARARPTMLAFRLVYCINGKPRSSLLIESTDSMICIHG